MKTSIALLLLSTIIWTSSALRTQDTQDRTVDVVQSDSQKPADASAKDDEPDQVDLQQNADELLAAARNEDLETVKKLLANGADVNAKSKYGATALYFAADRGNVELAKMLLQAGADPNIKDQFYNGTAIVFAQMRSHYDVIQCLLENGATGGKDILMSAVNSADVQLAKAVISANVLDNDEIQAARFVASRSEKEKLIELFSELNLPDVEPWAPTAETLRRYEGFFSDKFSVEVSVDDDKLMLSFAGSPQKSELVPFKEHEFIGTTANVSFVVEEQQTIAVNVSIQGTVFELKRTDPPKKKSVADADAGNGEGAKTEPGNAEVPDLQPDVTAALAADLAISSPNWPGFRGNGSRGVAEGQQPPVEWDVEENKNIKWKIKTEGLGLSCPVIWEQHLFITSAVSDDDSGNFRTGNYGDVDSVEDDSEYEFNVYCYDKNDGTLVWKRTAHHAKPAVKRHLKSSHANPTIATDGKHVVAFFGSEGLYCYSREGVLMWKTELGFLDSGWFYDAGYQWGFASSPIIFDDKVIVQCDVQGQSFVAALNIENGQEVWRTNRDEIPTWSTPLVHSFADMPMLVTNGTNAARGYDARDGQLLWELKDRHSEIVVPTPFVAGELIYICSGYSPIQPIYAIKSTARGDISLGENEETNEHIAWSKGRNGPYLPSMIAYGGYLYACQNSGIFSCYDARTGRQLYRNRLKAAGGRLSFSASPVAADGHLYLPEENGRVLVVKAGPKFEQVATNQVGESILATPAVSEGVFYIRTAKSLIGCAKMNQTADQTESQTDDSQQDDSTLENPKLNRKPGRQ